MNRVEKLRQLERLMLDCDTEQEIADLSTDFNNLLGEFMKQLAIAQENNLCQS